MAAKLGKALHGVPTTCQRVQRPARTKDRTIGGRHRRR